MRRFFVRFLLVASSALLLSMPTMPGCPVQTGQQLSAADPEGSLKRYLQDFDHGGRTRYVAAFYDLNGDEKSEAIVYLVSNRWCGSGGCNTLILARSGGSWRIVRNETITRPPIRVLKRTSKGWHDIGVWVQGGGVQPGYEADLRFDGKTYRPSPSAGPGAARAAGEVVIPSAEDAKPLHP